MVEPNKTESKTEIYEINSDHQYYPQSISESLHRKESECPDSYPNLLTDVYPIRK